MASPNEASDFIEGRRFCGRCNGGFQLRCERQQDLAFGSSALTIPGGCGHISRATARLGSFQPIPVLKASKLPGFGAFLVSGVRFSVRLIGPTLRFPSSDSLLRESQPQKTVRRDEDGGKPGLEVSVLRNVFYIVVILFILFIAAGLLFPGMGSR